MVIIVYRTDLYIFNLQNDIRFYQAYKDKKRPNPPQ